MINNNYVKREIGVSHSLYDVSQYWTDNLQTTHARQHSGLFGTLTKGFPGANFLEYWMVALDQILEYSSIEVHEIYDKSCYSREKEVIAYAEEGNKMIGR